MRTSRSNLDLAGRKIVCGCDGMEESKNVVNMLRGLTRLDASKQSNFRKWSKKNAIVFSINRLDTALLLEGQPKWTACASDEEVAKETGTPDKEVR